MANLRESGVVWSFDMLHPRWREELACHVNESGECVASFV
jgi:hypothetical protein